MSNSSHARSPGSRVRARPWARGSWHFQRNFQAAGSAGRCAGLPRSSNRGSPLEQTLETHEGQIPPQLRGLVIAGIRSGKLGDLLGRISEYAGVGTEIRRRLWLNLMYPFLTAVAAVSLFVFVCTNLVNQFELIFKDFGVPLPQLTIAVITISHFLRSIWAPVFTLIAVTAVCLLIIRVFLTPPLRRSLAARLPIVGAVWRSTSHAEFCHLLALLLESDLPLPEALRLTGQGVQDADMD